MACARYRYRGTESYRYRVRHLFIGRNAPGREDPLVPVLDLCNHFVRLPDHDSAAAGSLMQSLVPIPPLPSRALSGPSMGWEHLSGKAVHARWFRIARGRTSDEKVPDSVHLPILRQLLLQYGDRSAADQSVHRIELCTALG